MNETIDLSGMPKVFGLCHVTTCPYAETCLRHLAYPIIAARKEPFIETINPEWFSIQKGKCKFYLKNEKIRRARGFVRTARAIPAGHMGVFRARAIGQMGYKRYYQARRGEILLTQDEEKLIVKLAKQFGVQSEEYFDGYEYTYSWG